MKKLLIILFLAGLLLFKGEMQTFGATVCAIFQGCTGLLYPTTGWQTGTILIGQGNSPFATSSGLTYSTSAFRLDLTNLTVSNNATATNATTSNLHVSNNFFFGGVTGNSWDDFCTTITGGSGLCDGLDSGSGAGNSSKWATTTNNVGIYPAGGTNIAVIIGATATATPNTKLEVTGGAFFDRATATQATTTNFAVSSLSTALVKVDGNGSFLEAILGTDYEDIITAGDALTRTANDIDFDGGTAPSGELGGTWGAITIDDNITTTGWTLGDFLFTRSTGTSATTTNLFAVNANFSTLRVGATATSTINGVGDLLVVGSTTLQNFTGVNATTSSATTTNLHISTNLFFNGVSSATWAGFCTSITGGAGLCDGNDASGGASFGQDWAVIATNFLSPTTTKAIAIGVTTTPSLSLNTLLQVNATNTGSDLITASTSAGQTGKIFTAKNNTGSELIRIDASGGLTAFSSSTLQNFTGINSTSSNATTTTIFSGVASSTSLFSTSGLLGSLTLRGISDGCLNIASGIIGGTGGACVTPDSKWATSSTDLLSIFTNGAHRVGVGTTSPWASLSIASSTYGYEVPLFAVSTSTLPTGHLFNIISTTTALKSISSVLGTLLDSGARVFIGAFKELARPFGLALDQLNVNGRVNTGDWDEEHLGICSLNQNAVANNVCGSAWSYQEDTTGFMSTAGGATPHGLYFYTICIDGGSSCSANSPTAAAVGSGLFLPVSTGGGFLFATSTPILDVHARIGSPANATSSRFFIGFGDINPAGTTYETAPTVGCYFVASSTQANWMAMCNTNGTTQQTIVTTTFASSTRITATGEFYRFRIEADYMGAKFYMASAGQRLHLVANITTNIATSTLQRANIYHTRTTTAGLSQELQVGNVKLWYLNPFLNY